MRGELIGTYDLFDRRVNDYVPAELRQPISEAHISDFDGLWRPLFDERINMLKQRGENTSQAFGDNEIQDAHWQWASKAAQREEKLGWSSFAVEADGQTQGLMFATTVGFAREKSQLGKPLVQIDLIATAPWNRLKLTSEPRFKGVGRLLLATAISLSFSEEFEGRIGLHSLPQSESWYRDVCGMTPLEIDATKMRYFEMTEQQAAEFIK